MEQATKNELEAVLKSDDSYILTIHTNDLRKWLKQLGYIKR